MPRALLVATLALAAAASAAQEPSVLIALDSSRSLSAGQSRDASALARDLVARLATTTQPSVLSFDDSVHWLARPGEEGAEAALAAIRPSGRYTVLNDGLIEGVRSLANGGVLVVISDGKDENSATTLEDVARLASERGVRVVTLGAGRIDERTMKRLALLTGGRYAGAAADADPEALVAEIEALRSQVAAEKAPPAATTPSAPSAPVAAATPAPPLPAPATGGSRLLLLVGALVAAAGIVLGFLLARRRTAVEEPAAPEAPEAGTKPGVPAPEPPPAHTREPEPTPVDEAQLARLRRRPPVPAGGLFEVALDDSSAFQRLPFSESIERTLVLTEEVVLTVREPGRAARSFRIPADRAIDIGRDSKLNTLAFQDPTLSVQHLRLALEEGEIFLVDLGSTNGVVFEERRVESARLHPGDRFRAGLIEFELHLHRASMA
jgi:hypothetical protein